MVKNMKVFVVLYTLILVSLYYSKDELIIILMARLSIAIQSNGFWWAFVKKKFKPKLCVGEILV